MMISLKVSLCLLAILAISGPEIVTAINLQYHDLQVTWMDAFKLCAMNNGHIYLPYEQNSATEVANLLNKNGVTDHVWAGYFTLPNNKFISALGENDENDFYYNYINNQDGTRNCGILTDTGRFRQLSDCLVKRSFVCTYPN